MTKEFYIILILGLTICAFKKDAETIPGVSLLDCKISAKSTDTATIAGIHKKVTKYKVTSRTKVQTACYGPAHAGEWEYKTSEYDIFVVADTLCQYLDSIYADIDNYWQGQEAWSDKYNTNGDFSHLPVNKGFFKQDSLIIPYISTGCETVGAFAIIWFNKTVYKIVLTKTAGLGGLSSFISQNLRLDNRSKKLKLEGLVRKIDESKKLLANKIKCI